VSPTGSASSQLAIFDIDGTLTATNEVDDECYLRAIAEMLDLAARSLDWADAPHVTDGAITRWLWTRHRGRMPEAHEVAELRDRFLVMLERELAREPGQFTAIEGAGAIFDVLRGAGWQVAVATGGWRACATLKLRAAGLAAADVPMACADDADSREELVRLAWERAATAAGAPFRRVVSIGDAPWDVRTARALGLPFVGIGTGVRAERLRRAGAVTILPHLGDRAAVLAALATAQAPGEVPR
jgi:phosphoglycolate phosphatase-like HAD superfamily hydrolase